MSGAVANNLRLYNWYCGCRGLIFWLPIFFLFFVARLPIADVLLLEAVYYCTVVLLEVPSGYLADRLGRRLTLVWAMALWSLGCLILASGVDFQVFVLGQCLLAVGMALGTGSDSAFLYDTLLAMGRESEFGERDAKAQSIALGANGFAALAGGVSFAADMSAPYYLSAVGGAAALTVAFRFNEPASREAGVRFGPMDALNATRGYFREPYLRWLLIYSVGLSILAHVPYELLQPWLKVLFGTSGHSAALTPGVAGLALAVTMGTSAIFARYCISLSKRFGMRAVLLWAVAGQVLVIGLFCLEAHSVLLAVLVFRSCPGAVTRPLLHSLVHPRLNRNTRATWLSVDSLLGRLGFSGLLALGALWTQGVSLSGPLIGELAFVCFVVGIGLTIGLRLFSPASLS